MTTMDQNDCQLQQPQRQQSQIIANIENNSINFELDDDGYSQFSFKHHLRHDEGNSSRGSLHAVDNMSISTTNTSATARNFAGDNESSFLRMVPDLEEVQEADHGDKRVKQEGDQTRTSMFNENSDILNDQNYPKLYHSSAYLPTTAKTSRSVDDGLKNKQLKEKRRYSDTKLLNSLHFENEFLVKKNTHESALGSPIKKEFDDMIFDQLERNIQNILEMDMNAQKTDKDTTEKSQPNQSRTMDSEALNEKRNIFKSLPNLDIS